jgi:hypothetical protein
VASANRSVVFLRSWLDRRTAIPAKDFEGLSGAELAVADRDHISLAKKLCHATQIDLGFGPGSAAAPMGRRLKTLRQGGAA